MGAIFRQRCALGVLLWCWVVTAAAAPRDFDIPAGAASRSVTEFARQARVPLLFPFDLLDGHYTRRLHGSFEVEAGLRELLQGSGLVARVDAAGRISIQRSTEGAAAADGGAVAPATTSAAHVPENPLLSQVTVTGSRIERDGMTKPTPVSVISADELQVLSPGPLVDALSQLPLFLNNDTPQTQSFGTSGAAGASYLNLRGIGSIRTLILIDGRRTVPATRFGNIDIAVLPKALIRRVEVVTGGASAAYGSDAISGVVNLILDSQLRGLRVQAQAGQSSRGDYDNRQFSVAWGGDLGARSNLLLSAELFDAKGIRGYSNRDWFHSWAAISNPDPAGPKEIIVRDAHATGFTYGGLITAGPLAGTQFLEGGVPAPFIRGTAYTAQTQAGGSGVDPAADLVWILPDQQHYSGLAKFTTQLAPELKLSAQVMLGRSDSHFEKYPPSLWGAWQATIFADNAFLPQEIRSRMATASINSFRLGRMANGDMGRGDVLNRNDMLSGTLGLDWRIGRWSFNAWAQSGRNDNVVRYTDVLRLDRVYRAIDSVLDSSGQPICRSTLMFPGDGCVPLNPFGQGSVSAAAREYVTEGHEAQLQQVREQVAEATAQGNLLQLPAGGLTVAAGTSWRRESVHSSPQRYPDSLDGLTVGPAAQSGYSGLPGAYINNIALFEGTSSRSVAGEYSVWEAFGEAVAPLLSDLPFVQRMELNGAMRYAHYSGSGGIVAWKFGLDWQVEPSLRLRATRSRDVRAGSLSERYDQSSSGTTITDKLQDGEPAYAITALLAGNPHIEPEKAHTTTAGIVYRPRWLPEYSASIDYYDIRISDAIALLGAQKIIDDCSEGDQELCDLIEQDPATGVITEVRNLVQNVAEARSRGIDLEMSWRANLALFAGGESLTLRAFFNRALESLAVSANGTRADRAGQTGISGGAPRWQANVAAIYARDGFRAALQERMISSGKYSMTDVPGDLDDESVSGAFYTNLRLTWQRSTGSGPSLFLNITNLFDRNPPRAPNWGFGGSIPTNESLFDVLGRRFVIGFQLER